MTKIVALILAGGEGNRLSILSEERAKPAVIFGGRYRIIDFTLSNCINSGITKVGILTQYRPRSLNDHIGIGRPWDLDRSQGGVVLLQPYLGRGGSDWYKGTADAVYQNLYFVEESPVEHVFILAGDHVYSMRYDDMLAFHRFHDADVTVGVVEVAAEHASRFGVITMDSDDRVTGFLEKPQQLQSTLDFCLASMGIYVFNKGVLIDNLTENARRKKGHDFGRDIIPAMVAKGQRVYGYRFQGYWRDVGTIESYWEAHMDLLMDLPPFNLYDPRLVIRTKSEDRPPMKTGPNAHISRSLISNGCIINGEVLHSVLSPGVYVEEGARVIDSIVFDDTFLRRGVVIHHSILDKEVQVGENAIVGYGDDYTPNQQEPEHIYAGITVVGKRARLPAGVKIGRNCRIDAMVQEDDFPGYFVASGSTVKSSKIAQ